MANEENLNPPWKKGQSGNPKGMEKGTHQRSTIARKWLKQLFEKKNPITDDTEELTIEDFMTLAQLKKAIDKGDTNAYKAIMDSAHGAPKQEIEQTIKKFVVNKIKDSKKKDS